MGYRKEYRIPENKEKIHRRLPVFTVICFLLFLFLVKHFWAEGFALLCSVFPFSKDSVAVSALDNFTVGLMDGERIADAFSDFLNTMLS